ncbi:alkaline phosphatase-like [Ptychodera flava]|uniref:alkaline phosphatase-like n=1 Tax=Ptychodera flava TaxID=63121 RepID=UPI003969CD35
MNRPLVHVLLLVCSSFWSRAQAPDEWNRSARESLLRAKNLENLNKNAAKNVVFFLGDGMGVATITSARILKGQLEGNPGEETVLNMGELPHAALIKTYNTDQQVSDSAGTATAFLCGVKTKAGVIGVHDGVEYGDCQSGLDSPVDSVIKYARDAGKSTGIISTARITHATPACAYAHSASRNWESNSDIPVNQRQCTDIASQMIELGKDIKVIMGGGRRAFIPASELDPEYGYPGRRTDDRNLIDEWKAHHLDNTTSFYVWNQQQFDDVDPDNTEYLLGLFEYSHMQYSADRLDDIGGEPSLSEMVEKAIKILQKNENGFMLLVEGGRIDHAHHAGNAHRALKDTLAMDEALQVARLLTSSEDTLTIVTADHSHTNTIVGYPGRGNPILGVNDNALGADRLPYTTIMYANGPGGAQVQLSYDLMGNRPNLTDVDTEAVDYIQQATIPDSSESHGGEDVPLYADGPMAHLFHGTHEQHYIAHVIIYAACLQNSTESHCVAAATEESPVTDEDSPAATTCDGICSMAGGLRVNLGVLSYFSFTLCLFKATKLLY